MTGFNEGDRVEYDKFGGHYGNAQLHGWKGTVTETGNNSAVVRWDNDGSEHSHNPKYLKKIPNAVTAFVNGDRVRYTGNGRYSTPELLGKLGTVKYLTSTSIHVDWDDKDATPAGVYASNLEKVPVSVPFVKGDRVRFTGKHPSGDFRNDNRIGAVGTVKGTMPGVVDPTLTLVTVDWDHRDTNSHYPENLEKVEVNTMNAQNVLGDLASYLKDATTGPDPVEVLREQADKADEIAEAYSDFAEKLRAAADAFDAINNLTNDNL